MMTHEERRNNREVYWESDDGEFVVVDAMSVPLNPDVRCSMAYWQIRGQKSPATSGKMSDYHRDDFSSVLSSFSVEAVTVVKKFHRKDVPWIDVPGKPFVREQWVQSWADAGYRVTLR